jgi:hypothetical protein
MISRFMTDSVVQNMRNRIRQLRRIAEMSHNPEIIGMLSKMADEIEADANRLEGAVCGIQDDDKDAV